MSPQQALSDALMPAFAILPMPMDSPAARVQLLAIGLQESRLTYRQQIGGPARGLWQFERGGGVKGVFSHPSTTAHCRLLALSRDVPWDVDAIYNALDRDDPLAAGMARLLLFADSKPLPRVDDAQGGWDCYARNWRPGKPHRETWDAYHAQAREAVGV
jgi:hypothetical protein